MRLRWNRNGERLYHTGVDRGVLYLQSQENGEFDLGVAWSGLVAVTEKPTGAEPTPLYADNVKILELMSQEEYAYSIKAYTYPEEFEACDGSYDLTEDTHGVLVGQQNRKTFGFSYRTLIGDYADGPSYGYILHLVYNSYASPTQRSFNTIGEEVEAGLFEWNVSTVPVTTNLSNLVPTCHVMINSLRAHPKKIYSIEDILYGTAYSSPRLPYPYEIAELFIDKALYPSVSLYPADTLFPADI